MNSAEILKKVRYLEIRTRKLVNTLFAGQYHSSFKGQGMTFAEFREYVPGDDVRTISWPVTARTGKTFIKKFDEERELTFILVVDVSASTLFGSLDASKIDVIAHLAALFGFAAVKNNDHVGALLYGKQLEHYIPPRKGSAHVQRILRDIFTLAESTDRGTSLKNALSHLQHTLKKHATIIVLSDFWDAGYSRELSYLSSKHEVVGVVVRDPLEAELPKMGVVRLRDSESGSGLFVDTSSASVRKAFQASVLKRQSELQQTFRQAQVDQVLVSTRGDYFQSVIDYFRRRA